MYVDNSWLSLDPIYLSLLHATRIRTISRTWMDFKMADTSERRVFCNTILLKYHDIYRNYINLIDGIKFGYKIVTVYEFRELIGLD